MALSSYSLKDIYHARGNNCSYDFLYKGLDDYYYYFYAWTDTGDYESFGKNLKEGEKKKCDMRLFISDDIDVLLNSYSMDKHLADKIRNRIMMKY